MWHCVRIGVSDRYAIAWEGALENGYVGCMIDGDKPVLTLEHRPASRLCSAMNAEIRQQIAR